MESTGAMPLRLRPALLLIGALLVLEAGCRESSKAPEATPTLEATPTPTYDEAFAYEDCDFDVPDGQEGAERISCGTLTVPEDRDDPGGPTVELAVAILKARRSDAEPDPLIYLSGGPGGPALEADMQLFDRGFAFPIQRDRDIIFFDQRGVGQSEPALDCPEVEEVSIDDEPAFITALSACGDRLRTRGIDLDAYNSIDNAADIADLARALDYESYNLYGVSYGTRLALTAMRDAPERIRSVVLDSAFPLQANLYSDGAATFEESLTAVFRACERDAACSAFGETEEAMASRFFALADQLDAAPIEVESIGPDGESFESEIDGEALLDLTFEALYSPLLIAELPAMFAAIEDGDTEPLEILASYSAYFNSGSSLGMHLSVQCAEELPFNTRENGRRAVGVPYARLNAINEEELASIRGACDAWNVRDGEPSENEAVVSDIPTLVLAGEFDPITPPSYGRDAVRTLSRSYIFEFRGAAHGVLEEGCPMTVVVSFLADPEAPPDGGCVGELPQFEFTAP
jgi:pimeloyl-ACP methyl ester carboxylesterase